MNPARQLSPFYRQFADEVRRLGGYFNAHTHLDRAGTLTEHYLRETGLRVEDNSHISLPEKHRLIHDIHRGPAYEPADLKARAAAHLEVMQALGTRRVDTLADVTADRVGLTALEALLEVKSEWGGRIDLRVAAYTPLGFPMSEPERWELFREGARKADFLSALPESDELSEYPGHIGFEEHCRRMLALSADLGKMLHVHTDQRNEPGERGTERLLEIMRAEGHGRPQNGEPVVWVIHMVSPSTYDEDRFTRMVQQMLELGVGLICCPSAAVGMRQLRPLPTATYNSIPRVLELVAAGVPVRLGSDNISDICSPSTTADLTDEVFTLSAAVRFYNPGLLARLAAGVEPDAAQRLAVRQHLDRNASEIAKALHGHHPSAPEAATELVAASAPSSDKLDLQPLDPSFVDDPYPLLARLRTTEPLHRNSSAIWVLTRHADIVAALSDPRFGNAPSPYAVVNARNRHRYLCADVANNIIPFLDPPEHDAPRRLIGRAFARQIRHTPPDMDAIAEEFIAPLRARREFDLLSHFATPFAVAVIGRMLGVPREDESLLKQWSHWFLYLFSIIPSHEVRERLDEALAAFRDYFKSRLAAVREAGDGSLLAGLAAPSESADGLSDAEIIDTCMLLFADGVENVDRAIVNGAAQCLPRPELWKHLGDHPEAIPGAVDECLRFDSPALFVGRVARESISLHGLIIPKNAGVLLMLGSANRDPEVFQEPDIFKPDRQSNRHLAFGQGRHSCIGASLVRQEMTAAFGALRRAFPELRISEPRLEWTPRLGHRWLARLPVRNA